MKKIPKTIQVDAYLNDEWRPICGGCHFLAGCEDTIYSMAAGKAPGPNCPIWHKQDDTGAEDEGE